MTTRRVLFVLAGMSLCACSHDEATVEDANDENQQMQQDDQAMRDSYGSGNLAASPQEPSQPIGMQPLPQQQSPMNPSMSPGPTPMQSEPQSMNRDLTSPTTSPASQPSGGLCEGVAQPEACPVEAGGVQRAQNIDSGVMVIIREDPAAPTTMDQLERRVRCFESRTTTRSADAECLLAMPGVSAAVSEDSGAIRVRLVTSDPAQVQPLRQRARALTRRTGGSARGAAPPSETGSGNAEPGGSVRGNQAPGTSPGTTSPNAPPAGGAGTPTP